VGVPEAQSLTALLAAPPAVLAALAGCFGLLTGSFLNVVIHRLPRMLEAGWRAEVDAELCAREGREAPPPGPAFNLVVPRSRCPACAAPIRAHQNIPVLSWLLLRGRCAACRAPIPLRYPLVELATGVLFAAVALRFGAAPAGAAALLLTAWLLAASLIDLDTFYLPDQLTLPLLWLGLLFNLAGGFAPLPEAVIGACAGYLSLWSVYWAFRLATGREGMGHGDFKLLGALGAWLGWHKLLAIVLLSSVGGLLAFVGAMALGRQARNQPMPFGPYLALGAWCVLMAGPWLPAFLVPA
jgi:leader peptidase (prepilin peptidase)/N-methyltransferase